MNPVSQPAANLLPEIHRALLCPAAYPEPPGKIEFRETHISHLYLTEDRVFKVKKPLDLGFLDFTTPERRRHFCEEELRLNRRYAEATYLEVTTINRQNGSFLLNGPGEVVDYALVMRRLPEALLLSTMLPHDDPSLASHMDRLGRLIAGHHATSPRLIDPGAHDDVQVVAANWEDNFRQTEILVGRFFGRPLFELLRNYVTHFLAAKRELLRERQRQGLVREVHGDLHCEHICLTDPIQIFDCIEFSQRLRSNDVLSDLAFLLMDLEFRERGDLAARLLTAYTRHSPPEAVSLPLLHFYKVYRAWVRCKVNGILAEEEHVAAETQRAAGDRAGKYFRLAAGYLVPRQLILTCGLMGSGKSTLASVLSAALCADLWRSDVLRKELAGIPSETSCADAYGTGLYQEAMTRRTYREMAARARASLASGRSAVCDASFLDPDQRALFSQLALDLGVPLSLLVLTCPESLALERLRKRARDGNDASDGRVELYGRQAARWELPADPGRIQVDTSQDVVYNIEIIIQKLISRGSAQA